MRARGLSKVSSTANIRWRRTQYTITRIHYNSGCSLQLHLFSLILDRAFNLADLTIQFMQAIKLLAGGFALCPGIHGSHSAAGSEDATTSHYTYISYLGTIVPTSLPSKGYPWSMQFANLYPHNFLACHLTYITSSSLTCNDLRHGRKTRPRCSWL